MFNIVLFEPEIPPNTGNVIRLCANTGCKLHLVEPLGFELDDKRMRRAGLDYAEWAELRVHVNWPALRQEMGDSHFYAFSTRGNRNYASAQYQPGDWLVFGPETRGLPQEVLQTAGKERCLRIPMRESSRSLNLSNGVAIALYEAWRQQDFATGN